MHLEAKQNIFVLHRLLIEDVTKEGSHFRDGEMKTERAFLSKQENLEHGSSVPFCSPCYLLAPVPLPHPARLCTREKFYLLPLIKKKK